MNNKDSNLPFISIVIPFYNAQDTLEICLRSIESLNYPRDRYELILINNGSTDNSVTIAEKYDADILNETSIQSSYAARNKGIRAAQGELIAFTDSDCVVTEDWLTNLTRDWGDETVGCFAGGIEAYRPTTLVERFSERIGILQQKWTLDCPYLPYTQTANSAYRREVFEKAGLFIPELTSGGDGEMSWRMQKKLGLQIKFIPEALVYHKHRCSLSDLFQQFKKYETGQFSLQKHVPDYPLPTCMQRQNELLDAIEKAKASFHNDFMRYIEGKIDIVDFTSPLLLFIIKCGTFSAWLERDNPVDSTAVTYRDLTKFVHRVEEIIAELGVNQQNLLGDAQHFADVKNKLFAELIAQNKLVEEKEKQVEVLLNSTSWRITKPLRTLARFFRG